MAIVGRNSPLCRGLSRVGARTQPNPHDLMHASIWKFSGDPHDLLRRYDAMLAEIPTTDMRLHICLRAPEGIVLLDTCPSRDARQAFATGSFPALR
jgi:hypothetical protein